MHLVRFKAPLSKIPRVVGKVADKNPAKDVSRSSSGQLQSALGQRLLKPKLMLEQTSGSKDTNTRVS